MINTLEVKGMNHQFNYTLEFYGDMNVLTGLNGSGKTTLLKLIWYLTSGNLHRIVSDIPLTFVKIETDQFILSMEPSDTHIELTLKFTDEQQGSKIAVNRNSLAKGLDGFNERIASAMLGSLFLPTFRRPEGNYTSEPKMKVFQEALLDFSDALSVEVNGKNRHELIAATSTIDLAKFLKKKHDRLSALECKTDDLKEKDEKETLKERFELLRDLVKDIYGGDNGYGRINIPESISFHGKCPDNPEISSENLSAGEKQLLGFLCYAVFSEDAVIFIDEPESSLHVDYQRLMLPLLQVATSKAKPQFFVATHSPFIYSRFEDREINLEEQIDESEC